MCMWADAAEVESGRYIIEGPYRNMTGSGLGSYWEGLLTTLAYLEGWICQAKKDDERVGDT